MQVDVAKEMSFSKITMESDAEVKCSFLKSEFLLDCHISYYSGLQKFAKHLNVITIESILLKDI